jgi:hypothetical protein
MSWYGLGYVTKPTIRVAHLVIQPIDQAAELLAQV